MLGTALLVSGLQRSVRQIVLAQRTTEKPHGVVIEGLHLAGRFPLDGAGLIEVGLPLAGARRNPHPSRGAGLVPLLGPAGRAAEAARLAPREERAQQVVRQVVERRLAGGEPLAAARGQRGGDNA